MPVREEVALDDVIEIPPVVGLGGLAVDPLGA